MLLRLDIKRTDKVIRAKSRKDARAVAGHQDVEDEEVEDYRSTNPIYR